MAITELLIPSNREKSEKVSRKSIAVVVCAYILIAFTNYKMAANFNLVGPLLVIAYYWYLRCARNGEKTENKRSWGKRFLVSLAIFAVYLPIYFWVRSEFGDFSAWLGHVKEYLPWVGGHVLAALILSFSN